MLARAGRATVVRDGRLTLEYDAGSGGEQGDLLAVVTGFIDDPTTLARELELPPSTPQHVLVAAGFRRWDTALLSRLHGSFALLLWDAGLQRGLLAVDRLGARSVFWRRLPSKLAFAADMRDLLPLLEATPPPCERAVVRWLVDGAVDRDQTVVAGVRRLPGGHLLRLGDRGTGEPEPYRRPHYEPLRPLGEAEAARELRAALERATARACERLGPTGVLLSGGLDSAAVAATALATGAPLVAYSVVFPDHPETDESGFIAQRAHSLGVESRRVAFRSGSALAAALRHIDTWKLPPATPNLFLHEPLLQLAREDGITTLIDGQGGDELFSPSPYLLADRLRRGRLFDATRLGRMVLGEGSAGVALRRYGIKGVLPAGMQRALRARAPRRYGPWWLTEAGNALYGGGTASWAWKETPGPRWWAYAADLVTVARERAGVHDALRQMFADAGLHGAHPLLEDVDLIETVLSQPPELAFHDRLDRPVLRAAVADLVPGAARREGKSYFNAVLADAVHNVDENPLRHLLDEDAEITRYVNPRVFRGLFATPPERRGRRETVLLWRLAAVECWLRAHRDPGYPREALERVGVAQARFEIL